MNEDKLFIPAHPSSSKNWDEIFIAGSYPLLREIFQVFRIAYEFISGFRAFRKLGPCITFFGSARIKEGHPFYQQAQALATRISHLGFTVLTGGGPGIMEAANRGAYEAKGRSAAASIYLPHEKTTNNFVHTSKTFKYFFIRKTMLLKYSTAFIFFPGGYGTLDEATEALTLISAGKLTRFPLIFVGKDYWSGLQNWFQDSLLKNNMIHDHEFSPIIFTDDLDEVLKVLKPPGLII